MHNGDPFKKKMYYNNNNNNNIVALTAALLMYANVHHTYKPTVTEQTSKTNSTQQDRFIINRFHKMPWQQNVMV